MLRVRILVLVSVWKLKVHVNLACLVKISDSWLVEESCSSFRLTARSGLMFRVGLWLRVAC